MKTCGVWLLAMAFLFTVGPVGNALAQQIDAVESDGRWWLATFSQTGHAEARKLLHARPRYKELRKDKNNRDPDMPMREWVAEEPVAPGGRILTFVSYEGLFLCGSTGCELTVYSRPTKGSWKEILNVFTYPEFVGFGPESSHGYKNLVFLGRPRDSGLCPVWRFDGARYEYEGMMASDSEPCRSLNLKNGRRPEDFAVPLEPGG